MTDKPYTERTGGSYVRDDNGKLVPASEEQPVPAQSSDTPKKGK